MRGICLFTFILAGLPGPLFAQIDSERAAMTRMQRGKWSAAEQSLRKALEKDSMNLEATFLYSTFYFSPQNPAYQLDSAFRLAQKSLRLYSVVPQRQRDRLKKMSIDSTTLLVLVEKIDSAGFERAKQGNTEASYKFFLDHFTQSRRLGLAMELRNEVAFVEAMKLNTAEGFRSYLRDFPSSIRAGEASAKFEKLLYEENTKDGKLDTFRKFIARFPQSVFTTEVERKIFSISTASGLINDFATFIDAHGTGFSAPDAKNILYYLCHEANQPFPVAFETDSLKVLSRLNKGFWVPFFRNGLYGFMDENGNEVMPPRFDAVDSAYLCGNIREDFLLTSAGLFSRSGVKLFPETPYRAAHLGYGLLKVFGKDCQTLVHKAGFQIGPSCLEDAKIISDQFVALRQGSKWGLFAFNGMQLLPFLYEDIGFVDKVVLFTRSGKKILVRATDVTQVADGNPLDESKVFDDVRSWGEGNLLVKNGSLEGVVSQNLEFVIALDRQILTKTSFGFIRSKDGKLRMVGTIPALEEDTFDVIRDYGDWLELRQPSKVSLYSVSSRKIAGDRLDSLWLKNRLAFGKRNDSLFVYGPSLTLASFEKNSPVTFITSTDTLVYFWVPDLPASAARSPLRRSEASRQEKKTKAVFAANIGKKLFSLDFDAIESIGKGLFVYSKANKKGIISISGKNVLPAEFDAIIVTSNGFLSLLKDKKFGLYDPTRNKLIKPEYERNILPYSNRYFIAYKGGYGLISEAEEPVTPFEFEEIRHWNDTAAWVRKNFMWSILAIREGVVKLSKVRSYQPIRDDAGEKIMRIQAENYFGVISNRHGVIIPPTFTDVINIGSEEKPLYFTEKRVEEADIYVVIYYDARGKMIRKQVYEAAEYERIYCEGG